LDSFFIEPDWLESVRGTLFFYPAAGFDYAEPLNVFKDHLDTFWFCDMDYPRGLDLAPVFDINGDFRLVRSEKSGSFDATMENRNDAQGHEYRFLEPSSLSETYERSDGRRLCVVRRRGFGQIALTKEFHSRSIGVFMHRGDSTGESGSNVYFLANKKASFDPCGNLFDKLGERLADNALVISDGSNTHIGRLRRFHRENTDGAVAYEYYRGKSFIFGGFYWSCVGWLSRRYGPTLVWGLQRQTVQGKVLGG
jgi:hypothetical protein